MKYIFFLTLVCVLSSPIYSQLDTRAESVEYDPISNRFLASNGLNSSIVQLEPDNSSSLFGSGLTANLGMEIMNNQLFAITLGPNQLDPIANIKGYDLETETEIMSLTVSEAGFFNGMASDGISKLWVTDFDSPAIYEIDVDDIGNPEATLLTTLSATPNGITYDSANNRLVFVSWSDSSIRQLDLSNNSVSEVYDFSGTTNMDGIDMDGNGNFYVSSWNPSAQITRFSNDFSSNVVIDVPGIQNPADICIASEINVLAVPSFQHDVILFDLSVTGIEETDLMESLEIEMYPNPASEWISIDVDSYTGSINGQIVDMSGRTVKRFSLNEAELDDQVKIDLSALENGQYILIVSEENAHSSYKILIIAE